MRLLALSSLSSASSSTRGFVELEPLPYRPWRIKTCIAFSDEKQAHAFEQYLKTQSGRAFAKKRL